MGSTSGVSHAALEIRIRCSAAAWMARAERVFAVSTVAPATAALTACSKHSRYPVKLPPAEKLRCDRTHPELQERSITRSHTSQYEWPLVRHSL